MRTFFALLTCRLTKTLLRLLGRGGTALPGKVALKLCPGILGVLASRVRTVVVTGTNGKTTSSRIVEQALYEADLPYFSNRSGANLIQGIVSEYAAHATLTGKPLSDYAVIECDEGALRAVCGWVSPAVILVTNVFSDQLDRFGDVKNTLAAIRAGIAAAPDATLCLNADCSLCGTLADNLPNPVIFYGCDVPVYRAAADELSDAPTCVRCGAPLRYSYRTYAHLGGFSCPDCGYSRPSAQVAVTSVTERSADGTRVALSLGGVAHDALINAPGGYNIYNAAGAAAVCEALGLSAEVALRALSDFKCGFGRMEKLNLGGVSARMILVKNPAGCNQALAFASELDGEVLLVAALNDNTGDGTDTSWIWDADFGRLSALGDRLTGFIVSGTRADELALRLKYAGIPTDKLHVLYSWDELIDAVTAQSAPVVILPTYSAMMELRGKLSAKFGLADFWE
ncbi:MAG: MurT ligase domain-containing protein [Oscillospiraceae bacterium]